MIVRHGRTVLMASLVVGILLSGPGPGRAAPQPGVGDRLGGGAPVQHAGPGTVSLLAQVDRIEAEVAAIRGLPRPRHVRTVILTRAGFAALVRSRDARSVGSYQAAWKREATLFHLMGLLPSGGNLGTLTTSSDAQFYRGFYDRQQKTFYLGAPPGGRLQPGTEVLIAHEYTHALQDGAHLLRLFRHVTDTDRGDAATSLVEGDAVFTSYLWGRRYLTTAQNEAAACEVAYYHYSCNQHYKGTRSSVPPSGNAMTTRFLQYSSSLPYIEGPLFVDSLYRSGGYAHVNWAFHHLPTSMLALVSSALYFGNAQPAIARPESGSKTLLSGWRRVQAGSWGSLRLFVMIEMRPKYADDPSTAFYDWRGDSYSMYARGSHTLLVWRIHLKNNVSTVPAILRDWWKPRYGKSLVASDTGADAMTAGGILTLRSRGNDVLVLMGSDPSVVSDAHQAAATLGF